MDTFELGDGYFCPLSVSHLPPLLWIEMLLLIVTDTAESIFTFIVSSHTHF